MPKPAAPDPAQRLLWALLLQAFFSVRSERQRWSASPTTGCSADSSAHRWMPRCGGVTVFTKNRDRLLRPHRAKTMKLWPKCWPIARSSRRCRTITRPSMGVYQELPPDGRQRRTSGRNGTRDFHGAKLSNTTPASATDPDARLLKTAKGKPAKLCHLGHVV